MVIMYVIICDNICDHIDDGNEGNIDDNNNNCFQKLLHTSLNKFKNDRVVCGIWYMVYGMW